MPPLPEGFCVAGESYGLSQGVPSGHLPLAWLGHLLSVPIRPISIFCRPIVLRALLGGRRRGCGAHALRSRCLCAWALSTRRAPRLRAVPPWPIRAQARRDRLPRLSVERLHHGSCAHALHREPQSGLPRDRVDSMEQVRLRQRRVHVGRTSAHAREDTRCHGWRQAVRPVAPGETLLGVPTTLH